MYRQLWSPKDPKIKITAIVHGEHNKHQELKLMISKLNKSSHGEHNEQQELKLMISKLNKS